MRTINLIIIHCSATEEGKEYSVEDITNWHQARGFRTIGYHFLIHSDGSIDGKAEGCRSIMEIGAHAKGSNRRSIGICYIGGLRYGKPADTRTAAQINAMRCLVKAIQSISSSAVVGHRDLSADLNGDGVIQKQEWMKACPSFNVEKEL